MIKDKVREYRQVGKYDAKRASDDSAVGPGGPSMTVQSQAEDADINVLMQRYGVTGKMPENPRLPTYGDFTGVSDFRSALHAVKSAKESFMELPASVRARFENDPQQLLEFVHDDRNVEEARRLGLLKEQGNVGVGGNVGAPQGASGGSSPSNGGAAAPGAAAPPSGGGAG